MNKLEAILERYDKGEPVSQIADAENVTPGYVYSMLIRLTPNASSY